MKKDLLNIINHYGIRKQLKYFQSEIYELNEAVLEYENFMEYKPKGFVYMTVDGKDYSLKEYQELLKSHIAEEISDVMVMLKQFQYYYGIDDKEIKNIMEYKINRQLDRIKNEKVE